MNICEWYRVNDDCYINIPDSVEKCDCKGDLKCCPYPITIDNKPDLKKEEREN